MSADEAIAFAESGESTGGESTHEALRVLVNEVKSLRRRLAPLTVKSLQEMLLERELQKPRRLACPACGLGYPKSHFLHVCER